jgi:glycosyltransferase involved in cell wall biosynthesis
MDKILWHSNAPHSPTGYGQQTALFAPEIAKHYDMAISAFYGLEGAPIIWNDIPVLPGMGGQFGDEWLLRHAKNFFGGDPKDGLVVTLMDVWVLDAKWMREMNCACWVPVDHEPAPPKVVDFFVESGAIPIAMSRFGQRMLGRLDPLYVPHGVDCTKYQPYDRAAVREMVGVPKDAFLVGMVAANKGRPSRKGFVQGFQAFAKFAETHDNALLYLHTMMNPGLAGGEDLAGLLDALGVPQEKVLIADQYRVLFDPYASESMAKIYSTMDVLLNPSMGEGFGVPQLEAQACGVPVICTDFSAMPEVVGSGWHVRPATKYWSGLTAWQAIPDIDELHAALEECHDRSDRQRSDMASRARAHALEYALPRVFKEFMLPALRTVEQRFANQQPVTIAPRLKAAA